MTLTPEQQTQALDELMKTCPLVGLWAKTGQGKTTFMSQLMEIPRYRKMLFIDVDEGSATISHLTSQVELCDHRRPTSSTNTMANFQWACQQLMRADKVEDIGSIVIEGVAGIYNGIAAEMMAEMAPEDIKGNKARRCYLPAAGACKSVSIHAANLRRRLVKAGRSVPVIVTMTTKKRNDQEDDESWYVPGVSDNAADYLQEHCDAFVQLVRPSAKGGVRILTDIDRRCDQRKLRHAGSAVAVAGLKNAGLADMFQTWANARYTDSQHVQNHLQQEQE